MFKTNVGTIDRLVRAVLGIGLIALFFTTSGGAWHWLYLIGIIPLGTAIFGTCPVYTVLGLSTCPVKT